MSGQSTESSFEELYDPIWTANRLLSRRARPAGWGKSVSEMRGHTAYDGMKSLADNDGHYSYAREKLPAQSRLQLIYPASTGRTQFALQYRAPTVPRAPHPSAPMRGHRERMLPVPRPHMGGRGRVSTVSVATADPRQWNWQETQA